MTANAGWYVRREYVVEAMQVTQENMAEVAEWCGGSVETYHSPNGPRPIIQLPGKRGEVNDWITLDKDGETTVNGYIAFAQVYIQVP